MGDQTKVLINAFIAQGVLYCVVMRRCLAQKHISFQVSKTPEIEASCYCSHTLYKSLKLTSTAQVKYKLILAFA